MRGGGDAGPVERARERRDIVGLWVEKSFVLGFEVLEDSRWDAGLNGPLIGYEFVQTRRKRFSSREGEEDVPVYVLGD